LEQTYPDLPITWIELQRGGLGVGVLEADELDAWVEAQRETTS
jgi:ribosomal protein L3 glutamine methyltransferase